MVRELIPKGFPEGRNILIAASKASNTGPILTLKSWHVDRAMGNALIPKKLLEVIEMEAAFILRS